MSVWRDESKGFINGKKPTDDDLDIPSDEEQDEENPRPTGTPARDSSMTAPGSPSSHHASSPPPRPPSSASERSSGGYSDNDIDIDALIQEDAERQVAAQPREPSPPLNAETVNYRSNPKPASNPDGMDEDDDALWSSFNDPSIFDDPSLGGGSTSVTTTLSSGGGMEEDDDDEWQILREQEEEERARAQKRSAPGPPQARASVPASQPGQPGEQPVAAEAGEQRHTGDEGWDEMYL